MFQFNKFPTNRSSYPRQSPPSKSCQRRLRKKERGGPPNSSDDDNDEDDEDDYCANNEVVLIGGLLPFGGSRRVVGRSGNLTWGEDVVRPIRCVSLSDMSVHPLSSGVEWRCCSL